MPLPLLTAQSINYAMKITSTKVLSIKNCSLFVCLSVCLSVTLYFVIYLVIYLVRSPPGWRSVEVHSSERGRRP